MARGEQQGAPGRVEITALRRDVRAFLRDRLRAGAFRPQCDAMQRFSREFTADLARRGWVGMTLPERYGGAGYSAVERFAVAEELLAAGAPVAAHWIGERQIGPMLVRLGTESQRERFLPPIVRGEFVFSIGMSEPGSGSDLASVRTRAKRVDGGWLLNGQKIWTSYANLADFAMVLCRTAESDDRHEGLSQLIVDLGSRGVTIRPIATMSGAGHFCEVFFDDAFVPDDCLVGEAGAGWRQVVRELSFERSSPDRYLSTFPLLAAWVRAAKGSRDPHVATELGTVVAEMFAIRTLAMRLAESMDRGEDFGVDAALQKDAGTILEQRLVDVLRRIDVDAMADPDLEEMLRSAVLAAPHFTLRGGTTEVLRGIVARQVTGR